MANLFDYPHRQVVPIWRGFADTLDTGEIASTQPPARDVAPEPNGLLDLILDWKTRPTISVAADLISAAWIVGDETAAVDAAELLLKSENAPPLARDIARLYLKRPLEDGEAEAPRPGDVLFDMRTFHLGIHRARHQLSQYPRNPILWSTLARLHTTVGEREKADRAMQIALAQAPENRYILRGAARLYLHQGEGEHAHWLLSKSTRLLFDPWILAAELATASAIGKKSLNVRKARRLLEVASHSPFHLSELASAVGTLDADDGNRKRGRKLIELSLKSPSENSVAQADWLLRNNVLSRIATIDRSTSPEAIAWDFSRKSEWDASLRAARVWQIVQPFSGRPAIFSSHIASVVLEDYDMAIRIAEFGLQSNEEDRGLRNNLTYALASKGNLVKAIEESNRTRTGLNDLQETVFHRATRGLIAYRASLPALASVEYRSAISAAERANLDNWAAVARLHFAIEALKANDTNAEAIRKEAIDKSSILVEPWMHVLTDRVKNFKKVVPAVSEDLSHPLVPKPL